MYMKCFLVALSEIVKKDYPDINFEFYVSRRSKFVHMGLDMPLISIVGHEKFKILLKNTGMKIKKTIYLKYVYQD